MTPEDAVPWHIAYLTYLTYLTVIIFGRVHNFINSWFFPKAAFKREKGFVPLLWAKEYFYTRYLFGRIRDCWDRPIAGTPGAMIDVIERKMQVGPGAEDTAKITDGRTQAVNLGSYNYLGFAQKSGKCIEDTIHAVKKYGVGPASVRMEVGTMDLHRTVEQRIAEFVGKEDAIIYGMGYATNSTSIPAIVGKGGLIISDTLNHASIVVGCRSAGAKIKTFKHNDPADLERVLRQSIAEGQPRTHRDWKKILIVVEGIYSMEGEICRLPEIVAIKKKYKAYLYVDEAHSIGALGERGRGVCDHWGVDPNEVDVLMGTFTKSFGSVGGYIAGSKELIAFLRQTAYANAYESSMAPGCAQMILSALDVITGRDGTDDGQRRIAQLRENAIFFRSRLKEMGLRVIGDDDSPVIPLMLYHPCKLAPFSRDCLAENIAVVVVSFPATGLFGPRTRFCVSAAHTREMLEKVLECIDGIAAKLMLKYGPMPEN